jgi:hypothetical protein
MRRSGRSDFVSLLFGADKISFIYSLNKYLLNSHCVPGAVPGVWIKSLPLAWGETGNNGTGKGHPFEAQPWQLALWSSVCGLECHGTRKHSQFSLPSLLMY